MFLPTYPPTSLTPLTPTFHSLCSIDILPLDWREQVKRLSLEQRWLCPDCSIDFCTAEESFSCHTHRVKRSCWYRGWLRKTYSSLCISTLIKTSYATSALDEETGKLQDDLLCLMERSDPSSLEAFITVYGFVCDHHGTPYHGDVSSVSQKMVCTNPDHVSIMYVCVFWCAVPACCLSQSWIQELHT